MTIQGSSCYLFTILFDSRISRIMKVSILITTEIDGPAHQTISGFARGFYFVLPVLILFVIPASYFLCHPRPRAGIHTHCRCFSGCPPFKFA